MTLTFFWEGGGLARSPLLRAVLLLLNMAQKSSRPGAEEVSSTREMLVGAAVTKGSGIRTPHQKPEAA